MKISARGVLAVCLAWLAGLAWGADSATVSLETTALQLQIAASPAPHIQRLTHKGAGLAVVAEPPVKDLFQLTLGGEGGQTLVVESSRAAVSRITERRVANEIQAILEWSKFPGVELSVRASATVAASEPLVLWRIEIENRSGRPILSVRFPIVAAVGAIGKPEDDCLVLPALPGALVRNPAAAWTVGRSVSLAYPGNLSAQFLALQDRQAGVYLAGMDPQGHPMSLVASRRAEGFLLFHQFTPLGEPRQSWKSPYPVATGVTQGTWQDSADHYKRWAVRQPWCMKTLVDREDIPAWWKEGPLVHVCEVRTYDGKRVANGSFYPKLLEHLRALRQKVDGPVVAMLAGWENHRRWTAGDYFPIFDEKAALPVIAQIRKDGFRPFFYLSGLSYSTRNEGVDAGEIPAAEKFLPYYVVDRASGKPTVLVTDESSPGAVWKRHLYQFCVGPSFTKDFFCGVIDQAQARGVDVLQMDQTVAGAGSPCWSASHGHAPGVGLYQTHGFHGLLQRMRLHGKQSAKEFVLFHEEPHEQLIPHVDGFHVREYYEKRWYRSYPGAVGIPLFSYLYHEYALGYGGDSAGLSKSNDRRLVRNHALNLLAGRTPGIAIWSNHAALSEAHPDQLAMVRNHCRLLKTRARECLLLGRMLHAYELEVPRLSYTFAADRHGSRLEQIEEPAVLTSSWRSPSGRVGHLFVNLAETPQSLKLNLDTRNLPVAWPAADAEVYSSTDSAGFRPLWQRQKLPQPFHRNLAPLETLFIELRPSP